MREVQSPPVAGVPFVHALSFDLEFAPAGIPWSGTAASQPAVHVRHVLGSIEAPGAAVVLDSPPYFTYYRHRDGALAVRMGSPLNPTMLLVERHAGYEYELRYERQPTAPVYTGVRDVISFTVAMAQRRRALVTHSCAFIDRRTGLGVVCPGVSGAGKSTLTGLLRDAGEDVDLLTDDRAVVTLGEEPRLWGTPWPGMMAVAGTGSAPLGLVVAIRHAATPSWRPLSPVEASHLLLATMALPLWDPILLGDALGWIDDLTRRVKFIEYAYPRTAESARGLVRDVLPGCLQG